jgi:hypothetical protein
MLGRFARFIDQLGDVQQCLGRDAAAIQADAAWLRPFVHQRDLQTVIGRFKRRGIPTWATAEHQ